MGGTITFTLYPYLNSADVLFSCLYVNVTNKSFNAWAGCTVCFQLELEEEKWVYLFHGGKSLAYNKQYLY